LTVVLFAALLSVMGCAGGKETHQSLTLATTTSTQDSGLLDVLLPLFKEQTGIEVKAVAVGTGQALELGRRGDADVLMVHDPAGERKFMDEGHGALRREFMFNDFVLVGSAQDPAGVKNIESITDAFRRVASRQALFVSRGDESGTHEKEKAIWQRAGVRPGGDWYIQAGAGMGQVLRVASEKKAYTLTDRGTFLTLREGLDLMLLCAGDVLLVNQYSVIVVNQEKHPHVRVEAARKFADFLLSREGQKTIADFGKDRFGQALFFPGQKDN
jgi:tungstate transport system substrate-binding protein